MFSIVLTQSLPVHKSVHVFVRWDEWLSWNELAHADGIELAIHSLDEHTGSVGCMMFPIL